MSGRHLPKTEMARERILDMLESGDFKAGDKLPGAREIAAGTGTSLLMAQAAVKTLERDGILEAVPRSGAYLKEGWNFCVMDSNVVFYSPSLPWMPAFEKRLKRKFPGLRLSRKFKRGMLELATTSTVLSNRSDYLDMAPIFKEAFPDQSVFYDEPFKSFRQDGKLLGVPFIFSPRALIYNTDIFKRHSCPTPRPDWTWDDFIGTIRTLRKSLPGTSIFNFSCGSFLWTNFVFHAGGCLFDPAAADPVKLDSRQTLRGLRLFSQIQRELGLKPGESTNASFEKGELAMALQPREILAWFGHLGFKSWNAVPLPTLPGGTGKNTQATDLVCVRRECRDKALAVEFLRFMLSKEIQDFIGAERYGIPIRRSSAGRSVDPSAPGDKVFFDEMANMSAEYNFDSPEISAMVAEGISRIWREGAPLEETAGEIASALRVYMKVRSYAKH